MQSSSAQRRVNRWSRVRMTSDDFATLYSKLCRRGVCSRSIRKRTISVMEFYRCTPCKKVLALAESDEKKCPSCNGTQGEVLSQERLEEGYKSGAYFDIDPSTGGRAKKRRRR